MEAHADLEQAVRGSLARVAARVPAGAADRAGRATRLGRRQRVARGVTSAVAVVAVTLLASGVPLHQPEPTLDPYLGAAAVPDPTPHPRASSSPAPAGPAVDLPAHPDPAGYPGDPMVLVV